jgi:hypothetical protein
MDFSSSNDEIDLHHLDARSGTSADDAFTFIQSRAFSGTAGELRYSQTRDSSGTNFNLVQGDVNGDAAADFSIAVYSGGSTLGAYDFWL